MFANSLKSKNQALGQYFEKCPVGNITIRTQRNFMPTQSLEWKVSEIKTIHWLQFYSTRISFAHNELNWVLLNWHKAMSKPCMNRIWYGEWYC